MNSSQPLATNEAASSGPVRPAFNWIELVLLPVLSSIMETQPIALVLVLFSAAFLGPAEAWPLGEVTITLLLLGLQWWAILVRVLVQRGASQRQASILQVVGLLLAGGITLLVRSDVLNTVFGLLLSGSLIICSWRLGINQARAGLSDELFLLTFKIGFVVMLVGLFLTTLSPSPNGVFAFLAHSLPFFFLSGLIGLSLIRLAIIRRENERMVGALQKDTTRSWLIGLTVLWAVIVGTALALEAFSFQSLQRLLQPLGNLLAFVTLAILTFLFYLLGPLLALLGPPRFPAPNPSPYPSQPTPPAGNAPHALPPWVFLAVRIALIVMVLLILFVVIRLLIVRWRRAHSDDEEEEIREGLPMRTLLRNRRNVRQRQQEQKMLVLEPLAADSARARYRAFLQTMAERGQDMGRRPNETPDEYQQRLLLLMKQTPIEDIPLAPTAIEELTHAYVWERYGGKT